jgi:hypothetical protein
MSRASGLNDPGQFLLAICGAPDPCKHFASATIVPEIRRSNRQTASRSPNSLRDRNFMLVKSSIGIGASILLYPAAAMAASPAILPQNKVFVQQG